VKFESFVGNRQCLLIKSAFQQDGYNKVGT
jgi:hypothetical protein